MEQEQTILVPDYICDVVLHPLEDLGIRVVFYPVNDSLAPDWEVIENIQSSNPAHAFLLVHYFGQPQDIEHAREFCDQHGLWLIEDNAHGYGSKLNGQPLGSFGDMGICSPHKQLQSTSGGILYLHGKPVELTKEVLPVYPVSWSKELLSKIVRPFPGIRARLRRILRPEPDFSDPSAFPEIKIDYYKADMFSVRRILTENWSDHAAERRRNWSAWSHFAIENGLQPVWKEPHQDSCPWVMPVYANSPQDRLRWLHWSMKAGIGLFPWPTLPEKIILENRRAVRRWKKMICFSLDYPKKNKIKLFGKDSSIK